MNGENSREGSVRKADLQPDLQFVLFMIKDTEYAVSISHVMEVIKITPLFPFPEAPPFIKGVIHLRGKVIPVMDLKLRFGVEETAVGKKTSIMIMRVRSGEIGVIVDAVTEVITIRSDRIEPPLPVLSGLKSEFVEGVAKVMNKLVMIVNAEKILSSKESVLPEGENG